MIPRSSEDVVRPKRQEYMKYRWETGSMTGEEYRSQIGKETLASSGGILKCHDIFINIITSQKMYGRTIDGGANLMQVTIWTMGCYNNGLGSIGVDIVLYLGLKRRLVVRFGQLSS